MATKKIDYFCINIQGQTNEGYEIEVCVICPKYFSCVLLLILARMCMLEAKLSTLSLLSKPL